MTSATRAIYAPERLPREVFLAARDIYRQSGPLSDPAGTQIEVGGGPVSLRALGVERASFQEAANRACLDLITLLGLNLANRMPMAT